MNWKEVEDLQQHLWDLKDLQKLWNSYLLARTALE
jgi:hypothetical protein